MELKVKYWKALITGDEAPQKAIKDSQQSSAAFLHGQYMELSIHARHVMLECGLLYDKVRFF